MTTELEDRLRAALHVDAGVAPLARPEWEGPVYVAAPRPRMGTRLAAVAAVAATGLLVAGVTIALASRGGEGAVTDRPPFLRGDEYPLEPVALVPPDWAVIVPGSAQSVRLDDLDLVVTTFDAAFVSPSDLVQRCIDFGGAGGCSGRDRPSLVGVGEYHPSGRPEPVVLVTWDVVPNGTAYVQFVDADGTTRWQRPVGVTALFPTTMTPGEGSAMPTMTAYDSDGREIPFPATNVVADWLPAGADDAVAVGRAAAEACLDRSGATWDACVEQGRLAAEEAARTGA